MFIHRDRLKWLHFGQIYTSTATYPQINFCSQQVVQLDTSGGDFRGQLATLLQFRHLTQSLENRLVKWIFLNWNSKSTFVVISRLSPLRLESFSSAASTFMSSELFFMALYRILDIFRSSLTAYPSAWYSRLVFSLMLDFVDYTRYILLFLLLFN